MAITWADLREYVAATDDAQDDLTTCVETATSLVTEYIGDAEVPDGVLDSVLLEVGAKLYGRRGNVAGYGMGETVNSPAVLVAKDPMVTVYPILAKYVVVGL